jgi:hypothetical protein
MGMFNGRKLSAESSHHGERGFCIGFIRSRDLRDVGLA